MKAIILAAGTGSRLHPYSTVLPKPLMPIKIGNDGALTSMIEHLIAQIVKANITEIVVVVNHLADALMRYLSFSCKKTYGDVLKLSYVFQETLDGNAGAFYRSQHLLTADNHSVMVTDCDNFIEDENVIVNLVKLHKKEQSDISVGVSRVNNVEKFAIIKVNKYGYPVDIYEKPQQEDAKKIWGNLAKSGMLMLSDKVKRLSKTIALTDKNEYSTTQMIHYAIHHNLKVMLYPLSGKTIATVTDEGKPVFYDIGTWRDYLAVLSRLFERNPLS